MRNPGFKCACETPNSSARERGPGLHRLRPGSALATPSAPTPRRELNIPGIYAFPAHPKHKLHKLHERFAMNRSTTSSITRSTDFLSVPSTKRQRTSKDGRWRSRSPSESSNGDMSRSTTPMFDQSPSPSAGSSTSMEFEWSQSIGQQAQIAQGEDCHTADEVADDEECFGTVSLLGRVLAGIEHGL